METWIIFFYVLSLPSLERTQRDLVEQMEEGRKRRDEIEGLGVQLREEKAECNALQARWSKQGWSLL